MGAHEYLKDLFDIYSRAMIGVSTKIPPHMHGYHSTLRNIAEQLHSLGTDYLDLVLIEHPNCTHSIEEEYECEGPWIDTWRALEHLYEKGRIRSLGVSNFNISELDLLIKHKQKHIPLSVVRGQRDPLHLDTRVADWALVNNILYQTHSPMGGQYLEQTEEDGEPNPVLTHAMIME